MDEKIVEVFEDVLNQKIKDLSEISQLEIDSLDFVNILFKIESDLKIKISEQEIEDNQLTAMANLVNYVKSKMNAL